MIDLKECQDQFEFNVYPRREIMLVCGKNAAVWDVRGREYIDCTAGHGVASVGHANPLIVRAILKQSEKLITCSGTFYNNTKAILLRKLAQITSPSLKRTFLCNSGTEAIEAAIKFTRYSTKRKSFICAKRGFHGRTLGSLSATFQPIYRDDFAPLLQDFSFVKYNDFDALQNQISCDTAGIILEPVQGEGGVHVGDQAYFQKVRRICDEKGIFLILDEIQTGFCRTGRMFAYQHMKIEPDILCLAKAMAGGLPMGAVVCNDKVVAPTGKHGSTFGGNPLVCAAADAAIEYMLENKLDIQADQKGHFLVRKLQTEKLTKVREIRYLGLMIGIECREKVSPIIRQLMQDGILALPAGMTVLRLLPPLTISYKELKMVAEKLKHVLS